MARRDAIELADNNNLVLAGEDGPDSDVVKAQDSEPGANVPSGTTVTVTYGPVEPTPPTTPSITIPPAAAVPDLVGLSYNSALDLAAASAFTLRLVGPVLDGVVGTQSPARGAVANAERTIDITLIAVPVSEPASRHWLILSFVVVSVAILAAAAGWAIRRTRRPGARPPQPQLPYDLETSRGRSFVQSEQIDVGGPNYIVELVPRRNAGVTTIEEGQ